MTDPRDPLREARTLPVAIAVLQSAIDKGHPYVEVTNAEAALLLAALAASPTPAHDERTCPDCSRVIRETGGNYLPPLAASPTPDAALDVEALARSEHNLTCWDIHEGRIRPGRTCSHEWLAGKGTPVGPVNLDQARALATEYAAILAARGQK